MIDLLQTFSCYGVLNEQIMIHLTHRISAGKIQDFEKGYVIPIIDYIKLVDDFIHNLYKHIDQDLFHFFFTIAQCLVTNIYYMFRKRTVIIIILYDCLLSTLISYIKLVVVEGR